MLTNKPFRSSKYRRYIATLPCVVTGHVGEAVAPHHVKGRGYGGSVKCSDLFVIPLRHDKHMELHDAGWQTWEQKYNLDQRDCVLSTLEQAYYDGVLKIE